MNRTYLQDLVAAKDLLTREEPEPLEGTRMDLFNSIIPNWFAENGMSTTGLYYPGKAELADRTWVANRCVQLNAQQISSMPLHFHGPSDSSPEPAWISHPDPNVFPNGIGDALHCMVEFVYKWGFVCLYVTSEYANGFPRTFTVLPSSIMDIRFGEESGRREYRLGSSSDPLDARRIVQIDRNPTTSAHGTSALSAYAQAAWGLLAAGNQSMNVNNGGIPSGILKSQRKLQEGQAQQIAAQWDAATAARAGVRVLPPELDYESVSFNPADLALLESQEFNAKAIATAFGVPSVLLNMALQGGLTYQNPASLGEMWWRFELRPTATRIANALSAQMLPAGQWVDFDAADTFLPLDEMSGEDDTQPSQVAKASPAQQPRPLTAIGGGAT